MSSRDEMGGGLRPVGDTGVFVGRYDAFTDGDELATGVDFSDIFLRQFAERTPGP